MRAVDALAELDDQRGVAAGQEPDVGGSCVCMGSRWLNDGSVPVAAARRLYGLPIDSTIARSPPAERSRGISREALTMAKMINLNADIAEGWGAYDIGNDAELMKIIKSASVACGFHAGDPNTMHRLCMLAKEKGVSVGVHPGFNDLWGFGRRRIQMKPADLEYMVAYQIGALQAMAAYAGLKVTHLKPHGALNNMAAEDEATPWPSAGPSRPSTADIIYVALYGLADGEGGARSWGCRWRAKASPTAATTTTATSPRAPSPARCSRTRRPRRAGAAHGARRRDRRHERQARQGQGATRCACTATRRPAWRWRAASARRWKRPASPSCR